MLRTTRKEVKDAIKAYIMGSVSEWYDNNRDYFDGELANLDSRDYGDMCKALLLEFKAEYLHGYNARITDKFALFESWASGLAMNGLFLYYYNVSAVDLLGEWLMETESEKARYTEEQAEKHITRLIWREVFAHCDAFQILYH